MATSMKEALKDNWSNANGLDDEPHIRLLNKVDAMSMLIGTYLLLNWSYFVISSHLVPKRLIKI